MAVWGRSQLHLIYVSLYILKWEKTTAYIYKSTRNSSKWIDNTPTDKKKYTCDTDNCTKIANNDNKNNTHSFTLNDTNSNKKVNSFTEDTNNNYTNRI